MPGLNSATDQDPWKSAVLLVAIARLPSLTNGKAVQISAMFVERRTLEMKTTDHREMDVIKQDSQQTIHAPSPSAIYTRDVYRQEHPIILPILYLGTKGQCAHFKGLTGRGRERDSGTITESARQDAHQKTQR